MFRKAILVTLSHVILVLGAIGCGSESTPTAVPPTAAPTVVQPTSTKVVAPTSTQAPTSAPTKAPASANPTQVPPTSAPATQAAAQPTATSSASASASFDGEWEGKTSENSPVYFTVRDNEISYANVNFSIGSGGCQGLAGNSAWSVQGAPIRDNAFTVLEQDQDRQIEFNGTFQSPTQASGTAHIEGNSRLCGDYELDVTWTANPESVVQATAEAKPTDPPAASIGTGAACAIFLQADLEAYLGKKVKFTSDEASGWKLGSGKVSGCQYDVVDSMLEGSQLILGETSSPEQAKTDFDQGFLKDAKAMGLVPEAVSGVGDEAYWLPGMEIFTARSGKYLMLLAIAGQTGSDAKLVEFVNEMLERLSSNQSGNPAPTTAAGPKPTAAVPTSAPTQPPAADNAALVQQTFAALNAGELDRALATFDDNVIFNFGTNGGIGKDDLKSYLQSAAAGANFTAQNVRTVGDLVTFAVTVTGPLAGTYPSSSIIFDNGKISIFTIR